MKEEVELRKLRRTDLLEMLIEQSKEVETLKGRIQELEGKLEDRTIQLDKAGTIAEAAFQMNGVLEAAEAAAKQYLDNLQQFTERQEAICLQKTEETEAYVNKLKADTEAACSEKERSTADRCSAMELALNERCDLMKKETKEKCSKLEQETSEKCARLTRESEEKSAARIQEAEDYYRTMTEKAERDVETRWEMLSQRLEDFYRAHKGLRQLLTADGGIQREEE